jgi:S1-C subfamily serine protease
MVSCVSTSAYMNLQKTNDAKFYILQGNDPLNLYSIVQEEISRRGYNVNITLNINSIKNTPQETESSGTGFFINNDGTIMTCAHVINGAKNIVVNINGTQYNATVISTNINTDLAIIKINYANNYYFIVSESEKENIGNRIYTLGFPLANILGAEIRLTDGIISARNGIDSNPTYFQISAPIQPGNSGGPIFNENFQVIGITSSKLSDMYTLQQTGTLPQNVNFGIKSEYAKLLGAQYFNNGNTIKTIPDAINATVQIISDPNVSENNNQMTNIVIQIYYTYYFDLIHYTLTNLKIDFIDASTGNVVGSGVHRGDGFSGAESITRNIINQMLNKIK